MHALAFLKFHELQPYIAYILFMNSLNSEQVR